MPDDSRSSNSNQYVAAACVPRAGSLPPRRRAPAETQTLEYAGGERNVAVSERALRGIVQHVETRLYQVPAQKFEKRVELHIAPDDRARTRSVSVHAAISGDYFEALTGAKTRYAANFPSASSLSTTGMEPFVNPARYVYSFLAGSSLTYVSPL